LSHACCAGVSDSIAGIAGVVIVVALTVALTIVITTRATQAVAGFAREQVITTLTSDETLQRLNRLPLIRYTGESAAEAIARKALQQAREQGLPVPAPSGTDDEDAGRDRTRGQIFQMVATFEGSCRVLLRIDDCDPTTLPDPRGVDTDDVNGESDITTRDQQ
jgi:hypothetical protein